MNKTAVYFVVNLFKERISCQIVSIVSGSQQRQTKQLINLPLLALLNDIFMNR